MKRSKCVRVLLVMVGLWTGAGQFMPNALRAGEAGSDHVLRLMGVLEPAGYDDIRSQAEKPLPVIFIAPEGSVVKKGDLLVELDNAGLVDERDHQQLRVLVVKTERAEAEAVLPMATEEAAGALQLAEQSLVVAEGELKMFVDGDYPLQVDNAQSEVATAQERLTFMLERLARMREQVKDQEDQGPVAEAELEVAQAKAAASAAQRHLQFLTKIVYPQRTAALKLAVAQRKAEVLRARNEVRRAEQRAKAALVVAQAGEEAETRRLRRIEQQVAASRLYAPRDGTVFYPPAAAPDRTPGPPLGPGTVVQPRQIIVRLADLTQLQIEIPLSTQVAARIAPREAVTIHVHAFPERTYRGHVQSVAPASREPGRADERRVTFRLDNPGRELAPGMAATIELDLSKKTAAPDTGR